MAASEPTNSSVRVYWTAPASAGSIELLGYRVSFERLTGTGCVSPHSATKSVSNMTTDATVTGLSGFSAYRISVAAGNIFGSSVGVISNPVNTLSARELRVHASLQVQ